MKKIWSAIKARYPLVILWLSVVAACWGFLIFHYDELSENRQDIVYRIESSLLDTRFRTRGPREPGGKIGILAVDEKSMKEFGRWPFSRKYYARALQNLKAAGVNWVGFDVVFSEREEPSLRESIREVALMSLNDQERLQAIEQLADIDYLAPGDSSLAEGIKTFEKVISGFFTYGSKIDVATAGRADQPFPKKEYLESSSIKDLNMSEGKTLDDYPQLKVEGAVANIETIQNATPHMGFFSNDPDEDAMIRWVTLVRTVNGQLVPSLSLKMAAEIMNRKIFVLFNDDKGIESILLVNRNDDEDSIDIPVDPYGKGRAVLNHLGPGRKTFKYISLADAYNFRFTKEEKVFLRGANLILGVSAIGINDQRPNPFDPAIDGVEHHAAMLENILSENFMRRLPKMQSIEERLLIAVGLLFGAMLIFSRAIYAGLFALIFGVGYYYYDKFFWFQEGIWAYVGMPYIEMLMLFFVIMIYKYAIEEKERKKVKGAFGLYLSPQVIDEVLNDPKALSLGGQRKELTVLFSDVRGFTTISESLTPEALSDFMNQYFTPMTGLILNSKGVLDKYIGDAIMAFWGAPVVVPDQADVALDASIKMLFELDKLRVAFRSKGYPVIDIGIGLNTGLMSVGNMGSTDRFTWTVMGDSVNLGSRLEALTKDYGIKIMTSEFTIKSLKRPKDIFYRDLDDITVKGKTEPVKVFEVMRPDILRSPSAIRDLIGEFDLGRKAYRDQNVIHAKKHFEKCILIRPDDGPSHLYLKRIIEMSKSERIENWDGVTRFQHK